ncbi:MULTISPECIES: hypothetical protein [Photorhabdus]|nr:MULTISPECIES: hypothetical protein [Photorhabdus]MCC8465576.1 hypothetical protein [Photorhabdus bodei]MCT8353813.1 hypothetical protein [Photorhabdus kayaii]
MDKPIDIWMLSVKEIRKSRQWRGHVFLTDLLPIAVVVINDEGVTPIKNR